MPNQCTTNPPMTDPAASSGWNAWGNDVANTRFQPAAAAAADAGAGAAPAAEVGVRLPHRCLGQRAASGRVGPRLRRQRQRLLLLARRAHRLRLLVVRGRLHHPQLADGRRRSPARALRATRSTSATVTPTSMRSTRRPAGSCGRPRPIRTSSHASPPAARSTAASCSCPCHRRRSSAAATRATRAARRAAASWRSTPTPARRSGRPGRCRRSRSRG